MYDVSVKNEWAHQDNVIPINRVKQVVLVCASIVPTSVADMFTRQKFVWV